MSDPRTHHILMPPPALATKQELSDYAETELVRLATRTLVVGGEPSFVHRKLAPRLRRHLLRVVAHWPWGKANGTFPDDADLLFVLTDMVSHTMSGVAIKEAQRRGVPVIMGMRKHALNLERLTAAGYPEFPPLAPKPVTAAKHLTVEVKTVPEASQRTGRPRHALCVEVKLPTATLAAAPPPEPAPLPARTAEETVPVPEVVPTPVVAKSEELPVSLTTTVTRLLAQNPGLTNRAIGEQIDTPNGGALGLACRLARERLGIRFTPGTVGTSVPVDKKKYERACASLGVTPVEIPANGTFRRTGASGSEGKKPSPRKLAPPEVVEILAASVPLVATVPATEVPAEVRAAYDAQEVARKEEASTTVEALRLLLEAMRAESVSEVVIRDDGSVSMQRRVVVTSNLTL